MAATALPRTTGEAAPPPLLALYLTLVLVLFATHLDYWLNHVGRLPLNAVHLLLVVAGGFLAWLAFGPGSEPRLARLLAILHGVAWPLFFFVLWVMAHVLFLGAAELGPGLELFRLLPFLQLVTLALALALPAVPGFAKALRLAGTVAVLVLGASILWDAFHPGTFSAHPSRAAGFPRDANVAAFALLLLLALTVRFRRPGLLDHLLLAWTLGAVFFTFSRGVMLLCALFALYYLGHLLHRLRAGGGRELLTLAAILAAGLLALLVLGRGAAIFDDPAVRIRIDEFALRADRLSPDESRLAILEHYLALVAERPFLGHGTGTAIVDPRLAPYGHGPHNMFLRAWVDLGLLGLVSYGGLLLSGLLLCLSRGHASGVCVCLLIIVHSPFTHTLIDEKDVLLALGIALATAAQLPRRPAAERTL
jgi:O-antigen ligase